ncbi:MAG: cell wall hydrolase [Caulobacteraceae bacterium]
MEAAAPAGTAAPFFYMSITSKTPPVSLSQAKMLRRQIATSGMYRELSGHLAATCTGAVSAFAALQSLMTIDVSTEFPPARAFKITGRSLRLAVLAFGLPVVAMGVLHSRSETKHWTGTVAQPALRGKLNGLARAPVALSPLPAVMDAMPVGAAPFILKAKSPAEHARAVQCLANAVYYEAALEPLDGQRAVAQVVVNRVRNVNFPHSICGVVYEGWERSTGCQFSFTCDGSLLRAPIPTLMAEARAVAEQALSGYVMPQVGMATHYHATSVDPWWRSTVVRVAQEGTQIFYRWPGTAGLAEAFSAAYAGGELKLSQDVIDGRAPRPALTPAELAATPGGDGSLAGAAKAIATQVAQGAQRVHVVAFMPAARRAPTPDEVAQINASLAKFSAPSASAAPDKPAAAPAATATPGT